VATLFNAETSKLAETINQSERNHETIARLVDRIETVVNVFASELGAHQFDVLLVSLNAQVAAARLPSADALNKLAEEAIRLSGENAVVTDALASNLASTVEQLAHIKGGADEFLAVVRREKTALDEGSGTVTTKLQRLVTGIQAEATAVNDGFGAVYGQVSELVEGLRFPQQIDAIWSEAETLSARLATLTQEAGTAAMDTASVARLEAHRARYTMVAEHEAHTAAIPGTRGRPAPAPSATPPAEPALAPGTANPPAEFGDGIELF
jgi:hypothetical protein